MKNEDPGSFVGGVIRWFVTVLLGAFVGILVLAWVGSHWLEWTADPPLMLHPEHVDGEWPFRFQSIEVSCCFGGRITAEYAGQLYGWRPGDRQYSRFPITLLGREGADDSAFDAAYEAALDLAREQWPEDVR